MHDRPDHSWKCVQNFLSLHCISQPDHKRFEVSYVMLLPTHCVVTMRAKRSLAIVPSAAVLERCPQSILQLKPLACCAARGEGDEQTLLWEICVTRRSSEALTFPQALTMFMRSVLTTQILFRGTGVVCDTMHRALRSRSGGRYLFCVIFLAVLRFSLCVTSDDDTACVINHSYDLEYALANAAVCRLLELRANITLTSDNFSAQRLVLTDQSVIIQSDPNATLPTKLDFGTYTPSNTIQVTGNSSVTLRHLQLQNYLATQLQNGTTTTFMPLFTFDSTSSLYTDDVHLLMDAVRCSEDDEYSNLLYTPRRAW